MRLRCAITRLTLCVLASSATACGWPLGDGSGSPRAVEIDLAQSGWGIVDGKRSPVPTMRTDGDECLVQAHEGVLEIFLRLPRQSRLSVGIAAALPSEDFSIEVVSDVRTSTLQGEREGDQWEASLDAFDGLPIKLRFISRSSEALLWRRPRVVGVADASAPILKLGPILDKRRANVVLYLIDTLRADRLSLYGYPRKTSPQMDRFAEGAVVFTNAYAPGSFTVPSVSSLFAARMPSALRGRLSAQAGVEETLAESFRNAGYATAAFQANSLMAFFEDDYRRGFDFWRLFPRTQNAAGNAFAHASTLHAEAIDWAEAHGGDPFFLFIQSMDVHGPQAAPAPFEEMFLTAPSVAAPRGQTHVAVGKQLSDRYDGRIAYQDHEIGNLVERIRALALANETAIVIVSDHGEPLGERGYLRHGRTLFEELVHVPLLMLLPGEGPQRVADIVSIMDLGPTLMDIAGIPKPDGLVGRSMLEPRDDLSAAAAYGELLEVKTLDTLGWYVRQGDWKLIMDADVQRLYHLPTDPSEDVDRSGDHPITAGYLATLAWNNSPSQQNAAIQQNPMSAEKLRELEDELRAIGYID